MHERYEASMKARPVLISLGGAIFATFSLVLVGSGCDGCRNDHPYVPYAIGDGSAAPTASGAPSLVPSTRPVDTASGEAAPPSTTTWEHSGLTLRAPQGQHFEHGLFADFDGDQKTDAVVVVRSFETPSRFAAYFYGSARTTDTAVEAPVLLTTATLASSPRAEGRHSIARVSSMSTALGLRASVFVTLGAAAADETSGARRIAFVDLTFEKGKPAAVRPRIELTALDPKDAPTLDVSADGSDLDGDGTHDLALVFTLRDTTAPPATAKLVFFDRPAGFARNPDEPRASLAALAQEARALAKKPKEATRALALVGSTVALARAVCPELPGARTSEWAYVADSSCRAGEALGDLALAEVVGLANAQRPFSAAAALERWRGPFASRPKDKEREAESALDTAFRTVTPREVKTVRAIPVLGKRHVPAWGPLSFVSPTQLDVLTADGVARVDLTTFEERKSDTPAWTRGLVAKSGARLVEVYDGCRGGRLRATFAPSEKTPDADPHDVPLPVETPLVPPCTTSRGEPAEVSPVAWGASGLELFVAGEPVLVAPQLTSASALVKLTGQTGSPGGAASPNGSAVALATSLGVLVKTPNAALRVKGGGLGARLTGCTVADDASRIACVDGTKAIVAILP